MDLKDLFKAGSNVTLAVSASDLRKWHREVIEDTKRELKEAVLSENEERYLTAKRVAEILSVDVSTLWRWEKRDYLIPIMVGGERRYKMSDINAILKGGSEK